MLQTTRIADPGDRISSLVAWTKSQSLLSHSIYARNEPVWSPSKAPAWRNIPGNIHGYSAGSPAGYSGSEESVVLLILYEHHLPLDPVLVCKGAPTVPLRERQLCLDPLPSLMGQVLR